jgi:VanZ family protein
VTSSTALRLLAWVLLAGLIFVTLSPINLRPISPLPTQLERAAALALVGFVFALAYPRHIWLVALIVLGSTALLELAQLVAPSRHGRLIDVVVKLAGGGFGLAIGWLINRARRARIKHARG